MRRKIPQPRFEVTIETDGGMVTHVIAAEQRDAAVERVLKSYERKNPVLMKTKPLGVMRKQPSR